MTLARAAKSDIVVSRTKITRHLAAAMSYRQFRGIRILTAAARAAHLLARRIFAPVCRVVWIRHIGAADPFPTVSGHVERAVGTCPLGKAADIAEVVPTRAIMLARRVGLIVAPGISPAVRDARGLFPLRF